MTEKLFYWAENLDGYSSDNEQDYDQIIEIKRLNFFIGKNNAGKSRFLRNLVLNEKKISDYSLTLFKTNIEDNLIYKLSGAVRTIQRRDNFSSYTLGDSVLSPIYKLIYCSNVFIGIKLELYITFNVISVTAVISYTRFLKSDNISCVKPLRPRRL